MNPWLYNQPPQQTPAIPGAPVPRPHSKHSSMPLGVWASDKIPTEPPDTSSFWENLPDWRTVALLVTLGYIVKRRL